VIQITRSWKMGREERDIICFLSQEENGRVRKDGTMSYTVSLK
jgi:hypothetical protein